jgi:hypothetical protein
MAMASAADPTTLDRENLTGPVRTVLGRDTSEIIDWQREPLSGSCNPKSGGVYRVTGSADDQGETLSWSLVLKVLYPAGDDTDPASPKYWKREVLAYQSGLLTAATAGVTAPRCCGIGEIAGERAWIWLEEVTDTCGPRWPLSTYGRTAYHLGRFNGAACGQPELLDVPWMSHGYLEGSWLSQFPAALDVSLSAVPDHPLVLQVCTGSSATRLLQVLADRAAFLAALDHLPQYFCHHDAWRRNLVLRHDPAGQEQTVIIDWADAGGGALGQELGAFV